MRRLNLGALLWAIFLGLTAIGISYLFLSGKLSLFLHPRTWGALRLATVLVVFLCIVSLRDLRSPQGHKPVGWAPALFLLPIMLALCCPPQMLSLEVISKKGLMGVLRGHTETCTAFHTPALVHAPDEPITIHSENFLAMMEALWENTDSYLGRKIEMLGFVYEDPLLGPDDFVLARLIMPCCAADAQVAGLLCRYHERGQLEPGQWVTVSGNLAQMPYYNVDLHQVVSMPYIEVTAIVPAQKPAQEYIYP